MSSSRSGLVRSPCSNESLIARSTYVPLRGGPADTGLRRRAPFVLADLRPGSRGRPRRSTGPFIGDILRSSERGSTRSLINGFSGSSVVGSISTPKSFSALKGGERLSSFGTCRGQAVRDSRGQGWIIRKADAARGRRILMPLPVMLLLLLALVAPARAGEHITRIDGLAVTIWTPDDMTTQPAPIVVFSHGFHGCATQSRFLMEALAADGYLVFVPNHRDAACNGGAARGTDRPEAPLVRPAIGDDGTYRDRADDITGLLAALYKDSAFAGRIDWQRVALVGHSLGGYTVLGLGGAWRSWRLPGVKAVLALSPYAQPFIAHHDLSGLAAPVMYQGGTFDFGVSPALRRNEGAYDLSSAPKYYVEFERATHFAWTDLGHAAHGAIVAYALAFLDHYVREAPAAPLLTQAAPDVSRLRYVSELGTR